MMKIPSPGELALIEGVEAEPVVGEGRLVLWVLVGREGKDRLWERIASVVGAEAVESGGIWSLPATSYRARQPDRGAIGRLLGGLTGRSAHPGWSPTGGGAAERTGGRRADHVLAWSENPQDLDARVRARWPDRESIRRLGAALYVVTGVETTSTPVDPAEEQAGTSSLAQAQTRLATARTSGSRPGEASSLTDLGIIQIKLNQPIDAVKSLEPAMAYYRETNDLPRQVDVAGYLGTALMASGQVGEGLAMLEAALNQALQIGDRFAEKLTLERLGQAYTGVGDRAKALACFGRAIELCRTLGDRRHEAILTWQSAIRLAELGRRDEAIAAGEQSIALLQNLGDPKAAWYSEHLGRYRAGLPAADLAGAVTGPAGSAESGPKVLKMALSAGKAMAAFLGSGLERVRPDVRDARLATCSGCEHHTGMRCRLCGCFTGVKTWLPHEACPIGRWTEQSRRPV